MSDRVSHIRFTSEPNPMSLADRMVVAFDVTEHT